ncbi:MAG: hypothetical protein M5U19_14255 [Microthrixaceae bacterium]|nr:hypothetical protein [Microthrixaceae bacterium]
MGDQARARRWRGPTSTEFRLNAAPVVDFSAGPIGSAPTTVTFNSGASKRRLDHRLSVELRVLRQLDLDKKAPPRGGCS